MSTKRNALLTAAKRMRGGVFAAAVLTPLLAYADVPSVPAGHQRAAGQRPAGQRLADVSTQL